jgi:hypothetical protein
MASRAKNEVASLRRRAARALQGAASLDDKKAAEALRKLAAKYLAEAEALEASLPGDDATQKR